MGGWMLSNSFCRMVQILLWRTIVVWFWVGLSTLILTLNSTGRLPIDVARRAWEFKIASFLREDQRRRKQMQIVVATHYNDNVLDGVIPVITKQRKEDWVLPSSPLFLLPSFSSLSLEFTFLLPVHSSWRSACLYNPSHYSLSQQCGNCRCPGFSLAACLREYASLVYPLDTRWFGVGCVWILDCSTPWLRTTVMSMVMIWIWMMQMRQSGEITLLLFQTTSCFASGSCFKLRCIFGW